VRRNPKVYDFGRSRPRFQKVQIDMYPWRVKCPMAKVKAAEAMT